VDNVSDCGNTFEAIKEIAVYVFQTNTRQQKRIVMRSKEFSFYHKSGMCGYCPHMPLPFVFMPRAAKVFQYISTRAEISIEKTHSPVRLFGCFPLSKLRTA